VEGVKAGLCLLFPGVCLGENCCGQIISSGEVIRCVGAWPGQMRVVGLEVESNRHPVHKTMSLKTLQHSLH